MAFKLGEIEEDLADIIQTIMIDREWSLVYDESDIQIWREPGCVYVPELEIDVYSAVSCVYDKTTAEYETDSDLYIIYHHDTGEEVYSEWGSSLPAVVHNYAHSIGRDDLSAIDAVENLDCVYSLNWDE